MTKPKADPRVIQKIIASLKNGETIMNTAKKLKITRADIMRIMRQSGIRAKSLRHRKIPAALQAKLLSCANAREVFDVAKRHRITSDCALDFFIRIAKKKERG